MTDLAILYEHPAWFEPLFAALDRRGIAHQAIPADGFWFDPADRTIPAPVVFNRVAMSSFLRSPEHPIFQASAALAQWQASGARVINGAAVLAVDASKARQLGIIAGLGLGVPRTRVVHRSIDLIDAAAGLRFPVVVKANIGGSGAGIARYDDADALAEAIRHGATPDSIDRVLLVQEYVPARGGTIMRLETLGGKFLYALEINGSGSFDLCPADACALPGRPAITMTQVAPDPAIVAAAEAIAAKVGLDVGGVEVMIDDRDGAARFYDINALSNFVANPLDVLGWDPHERLVDFLELAIGETRR